MKLAIITDLHCGARNDSLVFNDYFIKFYKEIFFPYLKENSIKNIVCLGDVFDRRKFINFNTLYSWRKNVFEELNQFSTVIIQGNHDIYFKDTNEVCSLKEVLGTFNNIEIIEKPIKKTFDGCNILMMPWIVPEKETRAKEILRQTKCEIIFGHFDIIGFQMYRGLVNKEHGFLRTDFKNFDVVCSGHYHHKSTIDNISYLGSPYPMTWAEQQDEKGFHVFDTETRTLEFIENPFKIFHQIVYNDEKEPTYTEAITSKKLEQYKDCYVRILIEKKDNPNLYSQFLESLTEHNPADVSVTERNNEVIYQEQIDETKDTLTMLIEYINEIGVADEHKDALINVFREVYMASISSNEIGVEE